MTLKLEWISGGVRQSHTVTKTGTETFDDFYERAKAEFDAALIQHPRD